MNVAIVEEKFYPTDIAVRITKMAKILRRIYPTRHGDLAFEAQFDSTFLACVHQLFNRRGLHFRRGDLRCLEDT